MANQKNNSDNLSKGDVISFIAILLLGILAFFGANFQSLGDKVQSVVIAAILVILLFVSVFLAGFARGQNRNQSTWKAIEYAMIVLYFIVLLPTIFFTSKFFDIQFGKADVIAEAQTDIDDVNRMFVQYDKLCMSRSRSYQTSLKAMALDKNGRARIADILHISESSVDDVTIEQAGESFYKKFHGPEYSALKAERTSLESNVLANFTNWNIILVPQYASELGMAKVKFATALEEMYNNTKNDLETDVPAFNGDSFLTSEDNIAARFQGFSFKHVSVLGLVVAIILGLMGFSKYLLSEKRTAIELKQGDTSVISEDGGFAF